MFCPLCVHRWFCFHTTAATHWTFYVIYIFCFCFCFCFAFFFLLFQNSTNSMISNCAQNKCSPRIVSGHKFRVCLNNRNHYDKSRQLFIYFSCATSNQQQQNEQRFVRFSNWQYVCQRLLVFVIPHTHDIFHAEWSKFTQI